MLREQKIFPHMLVGHSFGGKVIMSMAQQFGTQLPRPVQVRIASILPQVNVSSSKPIADSNVGRSQEHTDALCCELPSAQLLRHISSNVC